MSALDALRNRLRALLFLFPAAVAGLGLVDREKAEDAFDLAIPVMVTGGIRTVLRVTDFFMVSLALGSAAVAGLELGFQYYFIGFGIALGLSSGTISVVSRATGAGDRATANRAIKQSVWLALAVTLPLTVVTWYGAPAMIDVLTDDPDTIDYGATYLRIVMLSVTFRFFSMIAARALQGAGDTRTPMYVRLVTVPTNIALNAVLIFGLGPFPRLEMAGAAWGTTVANTLAALVFAGILLSGRWSVRTRLGGRQFDPALMGEIVRVAYPLSGMQLVKTFGRFPFLFILATVGTPVVAAYAIGRRVMLLALMPAWGYSTAASTLVGQHLGAGEEREATEYGWQTLRLALVTQVLIGGALVATASPVVTLFGTEAHDLTVGFVRVFGLGVVGFSVSRVMRGSLRGAGDTRWPLYGTLVGTTLRVPIAALGVGSGVVLLRVAGITVAPGMGLGVTAVFAAVLVDMYSKALVSGYRYWSGEWRAVARRSAVGASGDD